MLRHCLIAVLLTACAAAEPIPPRTPPPPVDKCSDAHLHHGVCSDGTLSPAAYAELVTSVEGSRAQGLIPEEPPRPASTSTYQPPPAPTTPPPPRHWQGYCWGAGRGAYCEGTR